MTIAETKVLIEARWLRYKLKFKHPIKLKCPPFLAPYSETPNNWSFSTLILLPQKTPPNQNY